MDAYIARSGRVRRQGLEPRTRGLREVARLGAQLLTQAALEAEVTEFLGRDRYARAALTEDARPGSATATGR
jgi:transposase-like protein